MLLHMGVFGQTAPGPQGMKEPIKEAFANFTAWRRQRKIQCSHRPFSYKSIFKDEYGCYLNAKGFNARLICQWLLDVVLWVKTQPDVILNTDDRLDVTEQCLKLGFQMVYVWFLFQVGIGVLTYVSYKIPKIILLHISRSFQERDLPIFLFEWACLEMAEACRSSA